MAAIVLFSILVVILLLVLAYLVYLARFYKNSYYWPSVQGTITFCKIRTYSPRNEPRQWSISLSYVYTVEGKTYRNSRVGYGSLQTTEMFALERQYQQQLPVRVYYHPSKHKESVLRPGEYGNLRAAIGIIALVLLVLASLIIQRIRHYLYYGA